MLRAAAFGVMAEQANVNVNDPERWISVILGSAVAAYGLKSRSLPGLLVAVAGGALVWRGASGYCMLYDTLGVTSVAESDDRSQVSVPYGKGVRVEKAVTIDAPPERVYAFWRHFPNLPQFLQHLESVEVHDGKRSRWTARGPAGTTVSWEAEIINEVPNELIGWRSVDGSQVDNAGSVNFKPAGGGTEVKVLLRYDPPAGRFGARVSKLLGDDPASNVEQDLQRLKTLLETGAAG
jgi:uncharacterized membrane protein